MLLGGSGDERLRPDEAGGGLMIYRFTDLQIRFGRKR